LLSIPSHPSILNITSAIIIRKKILNCTQYRDNNNTKGNDGKTEKNRETSFPKAKNQYRNQREMKKTDTQIQTPTK
jgi:hypothetical protein